MKYISIIFFLSLLSVSVSAKGIKPDALILRYPDVSKDSVVFVYAGDLWTVSKKGGTARRLSSPPGPELFPKFSPDGSTIAFSANYDGNTDVYTIPAKGGRPERLTHHPDDDLVVDWYPDGTKILYRSEMLSHVRRYNRLFLQPVEGGMPETLPFFYGELASFNKDGSEIAFQFSSRQLDNWKRYTGGMASDIWMYDFVERKYSKFTSFKGTDAVPMWRGDVLYFLSDRGKEKKLNIWSYSIKDDNFTQLTRFTEYDVKWPSIGPGDIVFENAGKLYLLDLKSTGVHEITVHIPFDAPELRPELKDLSGYIENFDISPKGQSALVEARGEVFTINTKNDFVQNHTASSGIAERYPAWSPDGKKIAYFSDSEGEYNLVIDKAESEGTSARVTDNKSGYYFDPVWSPDSRMVAYTDQAGNIYINDISKKRSALVDTDEWNMIKGASWSPDSKWLTYSKTCNNGLDSIFIYNVKTGISRRVTSDFYSDMLPVFGKEGKYLYFYSNREFDPVYGDFDESWTYPNATEIYVLYLRKDVPLIDSIESDVAETGDNSKQTALNEGKGNDTSPVGFTIDFDGIESRVSRLDIKNGNFGRMEALENALVYLRFPNAGTSTSQDMSGKLYYYDIDQKKEKQILSGIADFHLSFGGKKLIYKKGEVLGIVDTDKKSANTSGIVDTGNIEALIDPREEWTQIFNEAWRIERDFFYDPNMHGVNWKKMKERYSYLLPYVTSRYDLNFVIGELIGELNSSHTYVGGGDIEEPRSVSVGLPGCDFRYDQEKDAFVISRIYTGGKIAPELRSPLLESGEKVKSGDILLKVNGRDIDTGSDPWLAFQGMADKVVSLTIGRSGSKKNSFRVYVELLDRSEDLRLRYYDWIDKKRSYVEERSNGRVGYIYVPDTGTEGQNQLMRQFVPQTYKEGLIIDERFNSGGQIPDRFVELLDRAVMNYWATRYFKDWKTPDLGHNGPKVMIINQWSGSGGDAFPYYFRERSLGKIVGERTMGALIGFTETPNFIDGGYVTAPSYAFWNLNGKWDVEGRGVTPDYKVEITPLDMVKSLDTQLDKAVDVVLDLLKENPIDEPSRPDYPGDKN